MESDDKRVVPRLGIVVPCYNEEEVLLETQKSLSALLTHMLEQGLIASGSYISYVDDGSRDSTWQLITKLSDEYRGVVRGIKLTCNEGHQSALSAGINSAIADCDAIVTIDADLQDDPDAIPKMVKKYMEGYDVVAGVRSDRSSDSWFKRNSAQAFYRIATSLGMKLVYNHADFRLLSKAAAEDLLEYKERNQFLRGIAAQIGRHHCEVEYSRRPRTAGKSKYPIGKMISFMVNGITSFSVRPVRMIFFVGLGFLLVAFAILVYVLIRYFQGETFPGWSSLMLSLWFCSGTLLLAMGVIGEYMGKIYTEVKQRPLYRIEKIVGKSPSANRSRNPHKFENHDPVDK